MFCTNNEMDYYYLLNVPLRDKEDTDVDNFLTTMFHLVLVLEIITLKEFLVYWYFAENFQARESKFAVCRIRIVLHGINTSWGD